ncbi:GH36-type glycosyl hydrolase domain-containing protein [Kordiimonas sp.]|uniref:GH36-type glycosyl hydrolase domain-containing protein n=1 Tax=Kordiimonas sp. TaxID=1970157 RepID=UPI003A8DDCDA
MKVSSKIFSRQGPDLVLHSPKVMPHAGSFLWNTDMMLQITCRGYATAQFMQPEPSKYSRGPALEATTFMQPEHPYYSHHSGRFFYVKDRESGHCFSAPYEPVRAEVDTFEFRALPHAMHWRIVCGGIEVSLEVTLPEVGVAELWRLRVKNLSTNRRDLSVYPLFSFGFLSWMNQGAQYDDELQAIVASYVTPYQKVADYFKNQSFREKSFLMAEKRPDAWCARLSAFEGEGGLHHPDGVVASALGGETADYETPVAAMQYDISLAEAESFETCFVFGPAKDRAELAAIRERFLGSRENFDRACASGQDYVEKAKSALSVSTPDPAFDHFVNHWMTRQIQYHGATNRLSTDPQTRNLLQDHMGMCLVDAVSMKRAVLLALSQQKASGEMPDGILLHPDATLKYINQVPHTDHCVWLPICLSAYLNETGDYALLEETVPYADHEKYETVALHITRAMRWIAANRDERGLSLIAEGDWCDPMNMVGYKGRGVSAWLTLASAYAFQEWASICEVIGAETVRAEMENLAEACNQAANKHTWDGKWYARGITDADVPFGVQKDIEGRIYLNPQSWAILSGAANAEMRTTMLDEIDKQLMTPYGVAMLAPAYTGMREDVGRLTQKFPGSAENGSVYNHAAAFYAYSLYEIGESDRAYATLRKMLPDEEDCLVRGQLPAYIPNYYRGAYHQFPRTAGRSSQLFNTGTVAWFGRVVTERLFGLRGCRHGLKICPSLPSAWDEARVTRYFRGAVFDVRYKRSDDATEAEVWVDGVCNPEKMIRDVEKGRHYIVDVKLPNGEGSQR